MLHRTYLLLGGNQGPTEATFRSALSGLEKRAGKLFSKSSLYVSEPWGLDSGQVFLNQAVGLCTGLDPSGLMRVILELEAELGRVRKPGIMESRPIDIDILLFDQQVISSEELVIPHPLMHLRRFALQPLAEIAAELMHPVLGQSITELLAVCSDPHWVNPIAEPNKKAV